MFRIVLAACALAVSACAPAPVPMAATDASELLERFAAGSAPFDVCTPVGRAELRGAVRAYSAAMDEAGEPWPNLPGLGDERASLNSVEVAVVIAVASGFVETTDLRGPARMLAGRMQLAHWPSISDLRRASRVACPELLELQQAASRFVMERDRYAVFAERENRSERASRSMARHAERMQAQLERMQVLADLVTEKVAASRAS